jgi:hypothetical protein
MNMRTIEMKMMALAVVLAWSGMAQAGTVLLSDNYNGIETSTTDVNATLAARQGGTLATTSYAAGGWLWSLVPGAGVGGTSALQCADGGAGASLGLERNWFAGQTTSLAGGGFTVAFDLNLVSAVTPSGKLFGVSFGCDSAWVEAPPTTTQSSFAVAVDDSSTLHVYLQGSDVFSMAVPGLTFDAYHRVQLSYAGTSLANGTGASLLLKVDGQWVDLNPSGSGSAYAFTMNNWGDPELNYLHLTNTGGWASYVDNLEISTGVVPEPASLALLGLGAAAWCVRRRRQG